MIFTQNPSHFPNDLHVIILIKIDRVIGSVSRLQTDAVFFPKKVFERCFITDTDYCDIALFKLFLRSYKSKIPGFYLRLNHAVALYP